MKLLFCFSLMGIFAFVQNPCDNFHKMISGLKPQFIISNYTKLYQLCPEQAEYIPSFLPIKHFEEVYISSQFGNRKHPIKGIMAHHGGVDIACKVQKVIATASGKVAETGYNNGLGNYIIINHSNGFTTTYAHLSQIIANLDDKITIGQTIAIAGNTGMATGTHVHYEVNKNGQKQNPIDYLLLFYYSQQLAVKD